MGEAALENYAQQRFQGVTAINLIPGREPYYNAYIPRACSSTEKLERLFMAGLPNLAQAVLDTARRI